MVAAPRDHEVGSCAALLSSWARLGTGKIMQVSHAFFRVFPVSFISGPAPVGALFLPSETSRSTRRCSRVAVGCYRSRCAARTGQTMSWACDRCTLVQSDRRRACGACGDLRPDLLRACFSDVKTLKRPKATSAVGGAKGGAANARGVLSACPDTWYGFVAPAATLRG